MKKLKLVPYGTNPQRSEAAHPRSETVHVPFDLSVRFRTALVLPPNCRNHVSNFGRQPFNAAPHFAEKAVMFSRIGCTKLQELSREVPTQAR